MDLSVILISKNQGWNIKRLIESVFIGADAVVSKEVILVDSASTDDTISIARNYPIRIIQLLSDQRLTSHAGRYIGYKNSLGDLILFLDGDMELCKGWLEQAMIVLKNNPDAAIVNGQWIDLPTTTPHDDKKHLELRNYSQADVEITEVGGAAMYKRSVLKEVGPFNPHLYSDGEPELSVRVRHAGYRIIRVGHPIAFHFSDPSDAISTLFKRWKRNLWLGMGQNMRQHLGTALFWPYVKERGYGCLPLIGLLVGIICIISSIVTGSWFLFIVWSSLLILLIILELLVKKSLYRTIYGLIQRILVVDGTVRGFFIKPMNPETFPDKYEIIQ
ncbi:MAG: glycosyltransferase [Anaerolineales bacterium]|nr:glycosyltransferase [Anaerolineales bacterium]